MGTTDPRVDAYIAAAPEFARPILEHIRRVVHEAGGGAIEESVKWGMPFYVHNGLLANMAAFKQHCAFGFWKGSLVVPEGHARREEAMGHLGRIASLGDLPPDAVLAGYVREAMRLNDEGVQPPGRAKPKARKPAAAVPRDLADALATDAAARATFDGFSATNRREYVEWIEDAKSEATRARRLATTLEWLREGKSRNWKYQRERPASAR